MTDWSTYQDTMSKELVMAVYKCHELGECQGQTLASFHTVLRDLVKALRHDSVSSVYCGTWI